MDSHSTTPINLFVITDKGRVVRSDKLKNSDVVLPSLPDLDYEGGERDNGFITRDEAYEYRDTLTDAYPTLFLDKTMPEVFAEEDPDPLQGKSPRRNFSLEEFQKMARHAAFKYNDMFWKAFTKLRPKDKCEIYLKMVQFGFPKAPTIKPLNEEGLERKKQAKKEETAEAIRNGIPQSDNDFEEEDE